MSRVSIIPEATVDGVELRGWSCDCGVQHVDRINGGGSWPSDPVADAAAHLVRHHGAPHADSHKIRCEHCGWERTRPTITGPAYVAPIAHGPIHASWLLESWDKEVAA